MLEISEEILQILKDCTCIGNTVYLHKVQLDRKTYMNIDKYLKGIGGKWNRKVKGHVFDEDPAVLLNGIIEQKKGRNIKKETQFFETPPELAAKMVEMAQLKEGDRVLEPSAGYGAILDAIFSFAFINNTSLSLTAVELNQQNWIYLAANGHLAHQLDFMGFYGTGDKFDKIIMNPPFTKQQDIDHVLHAYSLLSDNGTIVSIISESSFFRDNKKSVNFRQFLDRVNAEILKNDDGAFKSSGTNVQTRTIKIMK